MLKAARAITGNEPFPGERLLHRLLDKTYFAHVLPPIKEQETTLKERFEDELAALLGKGSQSLKTAAEWYANLREGLRRKD
jgi:oleate hydratase